MSAEQKGNFVMLFSLIFSTVIKNMFFKHDIIFLLHICFYGRVENGISICGYEEINDKKHTFTY